jgi:hypothetical protein
MDDAVAAVSVTDWAFVTVKHSSLALSEEETKVLSPE